MVTALTDELIAAYRRTEYIVSGDAGETVLHIDQPSPFLAALYRQTGATCAALVTACNPYSEQQSPEKNAAAMQSLETGLREAGYRLFASIARDPEQAWPDEPGFLVIGLALEKAAQLGDGYSQNAILFCGEDAVPGLVLLR